MVKRSINWGDEAKRSLQHACAYIERDSPKNAQKVKTAILDAIGALLSNPEKYPPDKYKLDNYTSYRAFELHHYRVVYRVTVLEIKVLTIRHTSMEPKEH